MALDIDTLNKLLKYLEDMITYLDQKQLTNEQLENDEDLLFSVEHHLHTAIESVINISEHIVAGLNLNHVDNAKDAIKVLAKEEIVTKGLAERLGQAADMRNVLVHQYFDVDVNKVSEAATKDLKDLRDFAKAVNDFLEKQAS